MKNLVVSIVSAAALATAGMAAASTSTVAYDQNSGSTGAAGVFISGGLGVGTSGAKKSDYIKEVGAEPNSLTTTGFAWNANIGYQFNRYVALEGGYINFGNTKATYNGVNSGSITTNLGGFGLDAKGILPVSSKFDVFAKAGALDMHETMQGKNGITGKVTGSHWTPDFGAGVDYNVNHNVAVSVQDIYALKTSFNATTDGVSHSVNVPSANAVLAGLSYKFNI